MALNKSLRDEALELSDKSDGAEKFDGADKSNRVHKSEGEAYS